VYRFILIICDYNELSRLHVCGHKFSTQVVSHRSIPRLGGVATTFLSAELLSGHVPLREAFAFNARAKSLNLLTNHSSKRLQAERSIG
jgi:hypothetical protein